MVVKLPFYFISINFTIQQTNNKMSDDDHMSQSDNSGSDNDDDQDVITAAPSLYERPCFFRQTRNKGKVIKTVQERYLRDDIGFGCYFWDPQASKRMKGAENTVGKPKTIASTNALLDLLGAPVNNPSPSKEGNATPTHTLLVIDTNVLLHQFDVLQQALSSTSSESLSTKLCMVLPQTALEECRAQHMTLYDQAVELLRSVGTSSQRHIFFPDQHHVETQVKQSTADASMNDVNDARLRKVALYFGQRLSNHNVNSSGMRESATIRIIFLTDDKNSRLLALKEQQEAAGGSASKSKKKLKPRFYDTLSVREWVQELEADNPGLSLMDYVAQYGATSSHANTSNNKDKEMFFPAHLPAQEVSIGVKAGQFHRGTFRSIDTYGDVGKQQSGIVTIRKGDERVAITIPGWQNRNRAMDGDVVAVALHSVDKWISMEGGSSTSHKATNKKPKESKVGISEETAEPTQSELSNVPDVMTLNGEDATKSLRPTGKVVGILRRNTDLYSGSLWERHNSVAVNTVHDDEDAATEREDLSKWEHEHADGSVTCVFLPVDAKIPPLLIRTTQRDRWVGQRLVVAMDSWPADSPFPLGHYTKTLGKIGDKAVETQVLLLQHNIPYEAFPAAVLACLPPVDYDLQVDYEATKERDKRVDLRHLPILSIDPPGCTDIDDALHCFKMENGNYQVGVHIADVT